MNSLFAFALACTLSTVPNADDKTTSRETATYVITDKLAIWLSDGNKLRLSIGKQAAEATIEVSDQQHMLHRQTVDLRAGVIQQFDLSQVDAGTYRIRVTIGQEVTAKTIQIGSFQQRTVVFR